jgi:signal transduction histidine kinase
LKSLHRSLRDLVTSRRNVGLLYFYLDPQASRPASASRNGARPRDLLARCVESTLEGRQGLGFREEDLLARGPEGEEWFVFLASPPRSKHGLTRRDLQEVERRVARELRSVIRETLPRTQREELPPLRSGAAVLEFDPALSLATQLEEARYEARLHGQLSRLLDDQISGLNHKIRTPLTTIKGVIEILKHDPDAASRFLPPLESEVDRIQGLLKQFSLLTRVQSGLYDWTVQDVDLQETLNKILSSLDEVARQYRVKLHTSVPQADLTIKGAVEIVEEAIRQIVDNAIRHGSSGKSVKVTLKGTRDHVAVTVADKGPGIPTEDLPHIFQPFYVVGQDPDTRSQGGGLGMCLARGIMEVHAGELECDSEPGQGTTVTLRFPRVFSGYNKQNARRRTTV